ncbi:MULTISPECIES: AraC family transcriptional regulator [unclassified Imperialibacter]|uniref:helix-turn-helix domain-containing protein n=1 Tax=unclassified Imperialibacter TaxID=2629706 RepID=UPI0012514B3C|nr:MULTISPECIES: helix-turn-helix domain-containing protein [unclassified Imperialibacter]CAD5254980.1 Transcriptional regulator (AraC family) protein [Imperialibacter sp. 75]CAD5263513.1 Transcriptional regulator (AraC family) protein [Imperialibacter sp. 89]VVT35458.1 Transcriptional regulator (AraC family) protein [Imperialibacter sp. EC-SDR9]
MTALRFLLLGYAFLTIFISGGLFFKKSGQAYLTLSVFILLFGLEMLDFLYSTSEVVKVFPQFYGRYYFVAGFFYGPVLCLHFTALLQERRFRAVDLFHFVPALIVIISFSNMLMLPGKARIDYVSNHFYDQIMPLNYARATHILLYGIAFIFLIAKNYRGVDAIKRLYALSICSIYFITAVLMSWLTEYADNWRQFILYYISTSSIVFIVGYVLYKEPNFLKQITGKYLSSRLSRKEMELIRDKIIFTFREDSLFLNSNLTLPLLGEAIDEKPHRISQTMSELVQESFNDFTNRFRIDYAKEMLRKKEFQHYKIEAVALESGFNNKVTFLKAFSKFTSQKPSAYRSNRMQANA